MTTIKISKAAGNHGRFLQLEVLGPDICFGEPHEDFEEAKAKAKAIRSELAANGYQAEIEIQPGTEAWMGEAR